MEKFESKCGYAIGAIRISITYAFNKIEDRYFGELAINPKGISLDNVYIIKRSTHMGDTFETDAEPACTLLGK